MLKQRIDQDLKRALLGGDKVLVTTLRGIKSAILYAEVAKGVRDEGLSDEEITPILAKEAKKRQESADLYIKGGDEERARAELVEKRVIEEYLPQQLSDEELDAVVTHIIEATPPGEKNLGHIIKAVKEEVGSQAEGSRVANIVKERLNTTQ